MFEDKHVPNCHDAVSLAQIPNRVMIGHKHAVVSLALRNVGRRVSSRLRLVPVGKRAFGRTPRLAKATCHLPSYNAQVS